MRQKFLKTKRSVGRLLEGLLVLGLYTTSKGFMPIDLLTEPSFAYWTVGRTDSRLKYVY